MDELLRLEPLVTPRFASLVSVVVMLAATVDALAQAAPPPPALPPPAVAPMAELPAGAMRIRVFVDTSGEMAAVKTTLPRAHGRLLQAVAREGDEQCLADNEAPEQLRCRTIARDTSTAEWDVGQTKFVGRGLSPCRLALDFWRSQVATQLSHAAPVFTFLYAGANVTQFQEDCALLAGEMRSALASTPSGVTWVQTAGVVPKPLADLASEMGGRVHAISLAEAQNEADWSRGWLLSSWAWDRTKLDALPFRPGSEQKHPFFANVVATGWRPLQVTGTSQVRGQGPQGLSSQVVISDVAPSAWWLPLKPVGRLEGVSQLALDASALTRPRPKENIPVQVSVSVHGLGTMTNPPSDGAEHTFPDLQIRVDPIEITAKRIIDPDVPDELDGEVPVKLRVCDMQLPPAGDPVHRLVDAVHWSVEVKPLGRGATVNPLLVSVQKAVSHKMQATDHSLVQGIDIGRFSKQGVDDSLALSVAVVDPNGWIATSPPCRRLLPPINPSFPWWILAVGIAVVLAAAIGLRFGRGGRK